MLVRRSFVASLALAAASLAGCCCEPWGGCYPCGPNWCGPQCGPLYWNEWYSLPPACCDPCNECSQYIGPRRNDDLYSHGNDYHGWCEHRHSHPHYPVGPHTAEPVMAEPVPQETAPAPEPYTPGEPEPYTLPGPEEDMPSELFDSSTGMHRDRGSRMVSYGAAPERRSRSSQYGRPPQYSRPPQRGLAPQRLSDVFSSQPMSARPVDSRGPSRKLARPPRTRLFSR